LEGELDDGNPLELEEDEEEAETGELVDQMELDEADLVTDAKALDAKDDDNVHE
jgi:hypothetical protein